MAEVLQISCSLNFTSCNGSTTSNILDLGSGQEPTIRVGKRERTLGDALMGYDIRYMIHIDVRFLNNHEEKISERIACTLRRSLCLWYFTRDFLPDFAKLQTFLCVMTFKNRVGSFTHSSVNFDLNLLLSSTELHK